jgi:hypothetical protein
MTVSCDPGIFPKIIVKMLFAKKKLAKNTHTHTHTYTHTIDFFYIKKICSGDWADSASATVSLIRQDFLTL